MDMTHRIERVCNKAERSNNPIGGKPNMGWLITVVYDDGIKKSMRSPRRCFAFIEDGVLIKIRKDWYFYDCDLNLVAVKHSPELVRCNGVSYYFYSFECESEDVHLNNRGERIDWTRPWLEARPEYVFKRGISSFKRETAKEIGPRAFECEK